MTRPPGMLDRRGALRRLGVAVGGGLLAGASAGCRPGWQAPERDDFSRSQVKPPVPGAERFATFEEHWVSTSCGQCPAGCGVRVRVVEGRAVRLEGNPANPINRGGIGARGLSGLQALYDSDRLRGPLVRVDGRLRPIDWETALSRLAAALGEVRAGGPEQLLVLSGQERGLMHELLARFAHVFGTPNFLDGSPSHGAPLTQAMGACLGVRELPAYAWERVGAICTLEAGLLEDSCRSIYFARVAASLRRDSGRRVRIVHAGPAYDLTAYNADEWLRVRPGTSGALALGVCRELIRRGHYDGDFVGHARDFAGFRALVERFTPERVAELTGAEAAAVAALATMLWERRPSVVVVDERSVGFDNGLDTAGAALALNALLGAIESPAGGLRLPPAPPLAPWPEVELDEIARRGLQAPRLDGAGREPFVSARAVLESLPEAIEQAPPRVALLHQVNPAWSRPQPAAWVRALRRIPMVVSFSPYLDETVAEVADLVLPDHTYLERHDDALPAPGLARAVVGVRQPAITPLFQTRQSGDVLLDLARRLGGPVARALPWTSFREAMEERLLGLHAAARGTIVAASRQAFLDELYRTGFWAEAEAEPAGAVDFAFPTGWSPPRFAGDAAEFPLVLLAYRPLGYAEGSGANQPWLRSLRSRPGLGDWTLAASLSPADLPRGLRDGDRVRVETPFGAVVLPLHVDARLSPGTVCVPMGGGHRAFGRWAAGFGANVNELLPAAAAAQSGASMLGSTRARVRPAREV